MTQQAELIAQALDTIPEPTIRRTASAAFRDLLKDAREAMEHPPGDAALKSMEQTLSTMQQAMRVAQVEQATVARVLESMNRTLLLIEQRLPPPQTGPRPKPGKKP